MPRPKYDEDIFKDSTMTFGEHLEELRKCLWRAVLGLLAGLIIGFAVGKPVVNLIQQPLQGALRQHYKETSQEKIEIELQRLQDLGEETTLSTEEAKSLVAKQDLLPEIVYVRADDLAAQLKKAFPEQFKSLAPGKADDADAKAGASKPAASKTETAGGKAASSDVAASAAAPADAAENEVAATAAAELSAPPGMMELFLWHRVKDDKRLHATALNAHEVFMIWLKASLLVGAVLSSPWIFYQIWSFIAAGLYPHERRYVNMYLPISIALFILGVLVAFFLAFPVVLNFLFRFNRSMGIEIDPRISEWLSFVMMLPLGFGISFQLPLVMLFLERIRICTVAVYWSYWRVAVVVIFLLAAIFTPPDPWSMSLLAAPLTLLYFVGIFLCKWLPRGPGLLDLPEPEEG